MNEIKQCTALISHSFMGEILGTLVVDRQRIRCERIAVRTVTMACKHEHVMTARWVCMECAAEMMDGSAICGDCREIDGHVCRMLVKP